MGIAAHLLEGIVREHKFRAITGDVLLLGRQTIQVSPKHAADIIRAEGLTPRDIPFQKIDRRTRGSQGNHYIRDDAFFRLLGIEKIRALDHSPYEGAEIIHDLNRPIPDGLAAVADFILDGSTLDNIFSPSIALQNITRMLRPGGRFISINAGTAHATPYTVHTGFWFMDYCAINRFADCHVYLIVYDQSSLTAFVLDPLDRLGRTLATSNVMAVVAFGEKGDATTWDKVPVQRYYAGADMLAVYEEQGRKWMASRRPEILRSTKRAYLAPSIVSAIVDYLRTRWLAAAVFDRIDNSGQHRRSSVAKFAWAAKRRFFDR
jgi:hypothetical protein